MGKAILTFDQIEILTKKSDSDHSDNDWLFVTWFVQDQLVRTDQIPLVNQAGSRILESGDHLLPVSTEVACADTDLVTASFVVMNLGAFDWNEQVEAAGKIASKLAEGVAEAYVTAAAFVVENSGIPLAKVFAEGLKEVKPHIVNSVGAFVEDVLVPGFQEIVAEVLVILGRPDCNGPVFHDIAVFEPHLPDPPQTLWTVYEADAKTGCGSPAKTSVHRTLDRDLDFVPQFPIIPPPQYGFAPSVNESPAIWLGDWADSNYAPPLVFVTIARSAAAAGLYAITIKEEIDRRFHLVFETKADPIAPLAGLQLLAYKHNVPGTVQPWSSHPVSPGPLQVFTKKSKKSASALSGFAVHVSGSVAKRAAASALAVMDDPQPLEPSIVLTWKRPYKAGTPVTVAKAAIADAFVPGGGDTALLFEVADGFRFKDRDITLAFYNVLANGQVVARALRYLRGATTAYTRADWMLLRWQPLI